MGSRFLISGVQVGLLKSLPKEQRDKLLDKIQGEQYVGYSSEDVGADSVNLHLDGKFND